MVGFLSCRPLSCFRSTESIYLLHGGFKTDAIGSRSPRSVLKTNFSCKTSALMTVRRAIPAILLGLSFQILAPSTVNSFGSYEDLKSRFENEKIVKPGQAGPLGPSQVENPGWISGTWETELTFVKSSFPLGKEFAEFKQLLAGNVRSPAQKEGSKILFLTRWDKVEGKIQEDKEFNLKNYYNAFCTPISIEGTQGTKTRPVAWMPILTQRGVYEKVNSVQWIERNKFRMMVKEIAPDLSVLGATPLDGVVVNRHWQSTPDAFVESTFLRTKRLSQGRVTMVETGTGDTEVLTEYRLQPDGSILGRHRVLVYLVPFQGPAGDLYAESEGRAVAVYDWTLSMRPSSP